MTTPSQRTYLRIAPWSTTRKSIFWNNRECPTGDGRKYFIQYVVNRGAEFAYELIE